jgi:hypothetical protein
MPLERLWRPALRHTIPLEILRPLRPPGSAFSWSVRSRTLGPAGWAAARRQSARRFEGPRRRSQGAATNVCRAIPHSFTPPRVGPAVGALVRGQIIHPAGDNLSVTWNRCWFILGATSRRIQAATRGLTNLADALADDRGARAFHWSMTGPRG